MFHLSRECKADLYHSSSMLDFRGCTGGRGGQDSRSRDRNSAEKLFFKQKSKFVQPKNVFDDTSLSLFAREVLLENYVQ